MAAFFYAILCDVEPGKIGVIVGCYLVRVGRAANGCKISPACGPVGGSRDQE